MHQLKGEEKHHALNQDPQAKESRRINPKKTGGDPTQIHHLPQNPPTKTLDRNITIKTRPNKTKKEKNQTRHQAPHKYPAKVRAIRGVHPDHLRKKQKDKKNKESKGKSKMKNAIQRTKKKATEKDHHLKTEKTKRTLANIHHHQFPPNHLQSKNKNTTDRKARMTKNTTN